MEAVKKTRGRSWRDVPACLVDIYIVLHREDFLLLGGKQLVDAFQILVVELLHLGFLHVKIILFMPECDFMRVFWFC